MLQVMILVHILAAVLATWRITDLFTQDRITEKLRKKYPHYIWQCVRCMSVWSALWTSIMFVVFPLGNLPFALAWMYLWHLETVVAKRLGTKGRQFTVELINGVFSVSKSELTHDELSIVMKNVLPQPAAQ